MSTELRPLVESHEYFRLRLEEGDPWEGEELRNMERNPDGVVRLNPAVKG